jgi:hypothetical protein
MCSAGGGVTSRCGGLGDSVLCSGELLAHGIELFVNSFKLLQLDLECFLVGEKGTNDGDSSLQLALQSGVLYVELFECVLD